MNNSDNKKQLLKDAAIFTVLTGLLVSVPLIKEAKSNSSSSFQPAIADDREFIDKAFPVLATWDLDQSEDYFFNETLVESGDAVSEVFITLDNTLGELESYSVPKAIQRNASTFAIVEEGDELSGYRFDAEFENGLALVEIILTEEKERTEIYAVNIESI